MNIRSGLTGQALSCEFTTLCPSLPPFWPEKKTDSRQCTKRWLWFEPLMFVYGPFFVLTKLFSQIFSDIRRYYSLFYDSTWTVICMTVILKVYNLTHNSAYSFSRLQYWSHYPSVATSWFVRGFCDLQSTECFLCDIGLILGLTFTVAVCSLKWTSRTVFIRLNS